MDIEEIEIVINDAINNRDLIAIKAVYNQEAIFFYPLLQNEDFFFGVEEFDFVLDGYQIRRMEDISFVKKIDNFSALINKKEGLIEQIKDYEINLNSFYDIFKYLQQLDIIISVEREHSDEDNFFVIGKIDKVTETELWFKDFNIDGKWNDEVNIIPYEIITTIRFDSKYINTWAKYI